MKTDKSEISDLLTHEIETYNRFIECKKPYQYIYFIVCKYNYPFKGMELYDMLHDHYNSHYKEVDVQPIKQKLVFRDFTHSIITWFYNAE